MAIARQYVLANKAMKKTLKKITYSSNQDSRDEQNQRKLDEMREKTIKIEEPLYSLEWIMKMAQLAEDYGVGNCLEKTCYSVASLIKLYSEEEEPRPKIYLFNNPFLDHFFAVVGNIPPGKEHDQAYWIGATVCDTWGKECYTLTNENIRQYREAKIAMLERKSQLSRTVYTILSPLTKQDDTIEIAGEIKQNVIVPRSVISFEEKGNRYKCQVMNPSIPMVYTKDLDYGRGVLNSNKQIITKKIVGFFSESKQKNESARSIAEVITDYLYQPVKSR
jgi:hypothetical protein